MLFCLCDEELEQYQAALAVCPWACGIYEVRTSFHVVVVELAPTASQKVLNVYSFPKGTLEEGEAVAA